MSRDVLLHFENFIRLRFEKVFEDCAICAGRDRQVCHGEVSDARERGSNLPFSMAAFCSGLTAGMLG